MSGPVPVTVTDEFLAEIRDALNAIRDHLVPSPAPVPEAGPVEVREPERPAARETSSPASTPATRGRSTKKTRPATG